MPRWWTLPESDLRAGVNTIWLRSVGRSDLSPGSGRLRLGSAAQVQDAHAYSFWRQRSKWVVDEHWRRVPNALLCLGLTRLAEEAPSNAIKHSRARFVSVTCAQPEAGRLRLASVAMALGA